MFLHHFPIIINCLYVCQSVSGLTSLLTYSGRKLKLYVHIEARTLIFGKYHPLTQPLRFGKSQFEGLCEAHVWAIIGPCLEIFC